jgi:hypothetical protein
LHGREIITIHSEHKPLERIFKKFLHTARKRLQRMLLRLQRYQLHVQYKQGKELHVADFLSRTAQSTTEHRQMQTPATVYAMGLATTDLEKVDHTSDVNISTKTMESIKAHCSQDPLFQALYAQITNSWPGTKQAVSHTLKDFWMHKEELTTAKGLLIKENRVFIPDMLRTDFLRKIQYGHSGIEASLRKACDVVFWPRITEDVKIFISKCTMDPWKAMLAWRNTPTDDLTVLRYSNSCPEAHVRSYQP